MTMTRQHFELIAAGIAEERAELERTYSHSEPGASAVRDQRVRREVLDNLAKRYADRLAQTNSAFQRTRFLRAAGVA